MYLFIFRFIFTFLIYGYGYCVYAESTKEPRHKRPVEVSLVPTACHHQGRCWAVLSRASPPNLILVMISIGIEAAGACSEPLHLTAMTSGCRTPAIAGNASCAGRWNAHVADAAIPKRVLQCERGTPRSSYEPLRVVFHAQTQISRTLPKTPAIAGNASESHEGPECARPRRDHSKKGMQC